VDKQGVLTCISVLKELYNGGSAELRHRCSWHVGNGCKPVKCCNVLLEDSGLLINRLFPRDDVVFVC